MRKIMAWILAFAAGLTPANLQRQADSLEAHLRGAIAEAENSPANGERIVAIRTSLGILLFDEGRYGEAEQEFRRSVDASRSVFGAKHRNTAIAMGNLADVLTSMTRARE